MKKAKIKRKTFAAREDLLDMISEMAKKRGTSLYGMVNEVFELTILSEELGVNLRNLLEERRVLKGAREVGFVLGLENLWYDMAEAVYSQNKREVLKTWYEAGTWLAKRYLSSGIDNPFLVFRRDLEAFTSSASELDIGQAEGEVSIRVISPRFPESYTFLLAAFLEGALAMFGYGDIEKEVLRGTIRLKARRKETNG